MSQVDIVGNAVTGIAILFGILRHLTVWLNSATAAHKLPPRGEFSQAGRVILTTIAAIIAAVAIIGSIAFPYPGLWGPGALVFAVLWGINAGWKVRYLPWLAPIDYGLRDGERIVLLGGSLGTLIAYLVTVTLES